MRSAAPRRASAARIRSVSRRISLRSSTASSPGYPWPAQASGYWPEYSARNSATTSASSPTTMLAGMIAPEKPPLRIA